MKSGLTEALGQCFGHHGQKILQNLGIDTADHRGLFGNRVDGGSGAEKQLHRIDRSHTLGLEHRQPVMMCGGLLAQAIHESGHQRGSGAHDVGLAHAEPRGLFLKERIAEFGHDIERIDHFFLTLLNRTP